ncbi:amino acid ABC transporter permease [Nakamurella sp. GG22]
MSSVLYDMAGPRTLAKIRTGSIVAGVVVAILAALVLYRLYINGALAPDLWSVLLNKDLAQLLLGGLWYTLTAAAVSIVLSVVFGVLLAAMRLAESRILRGVVRVWVEIFRGLPLLVLIFFLFLGMPALGVDVPVFWALVIGISLYNSAVMSEIFRAGIRSLPKGQAEAAYSVGLSKSTTLRLVLLPQAVRNMLPALVSQVVTILKESSLGFFIGYAELLRQGRVAVEYLGGAYAIPVYTAVAVIYLLVNISLSRFAKQLERDPGVKAVKA